MKKTIKVKLKGYFYIFDTYCYTLKEYMEKRGGTINNQKLSGL